MTHEHLVNQAIHGHVGTEPKVSTTANGATRATFRLGVPRRVETADGEWINAEPHYVTVAMYGKSAERTVASIQKGDNIIALGGLREYEDTDPENGPRVVTEFRAGRVGHDLNLSEVSVARRSPSLSAQTQASAGAETQLEPAPSSGGPQASQASRIWAQAAEQTEARAQGLQASGGGLGI